MSPRRGASAVLARSWTFGVLVVLLGSCSHEPASSNAAHTTLPAQCHFRDGQDCRGRLAPGTYHTIAFTPPVTYTVPRGWSNDLDTPGDFALFPNGSNPTRANRDTGDSLEVLTSVAMARSCGYRQNASLAASPRAYTQWLRRQPELQVRHVHRVSVGGLEGIVQTLQLTRRAHTSCPWDTGPSLPYLVGKQPTTAEHPVTDNDLIRLYLLSTTYFGERVVMAIEVISVHHGRGLSRLTHIVNSFRFGDPL